WLPVEAVTTPWERASSDSAMILEAAPRSLNAPTGWVVSSLSSASTPTRSDRATEGTSGVRTAIPAIRRRAASMSMSGSDDIAHSPLPGPADGQSGDGRVLDAGAGEVADRDRFRRGPPRHVTGDHPAQFDQAVPVEAFRHR